MLLLKQLLACLQRMAWLCFMSIVSPQNPKVLRLEHYTYTQKEHKKHPETIVMRCHELSHQANQLLFRL